MKYLIGSLVIIGLIVLCYFYCSKPKSKTPGTKTPENLPPLIDESEPIDTSSNEGQLFDPNNIVGPIDRPGNTSNLDSIPVIDVNLFRPEEQTATSIIRTQAPGTQGNPIIDTNLTRR